MKPDFRILGPDDILLVRELLNLFSDAFEEPESYTANQPSDVYLASSLAARDFVLVAALADGMVVGGFGGYELAKFEQERRELFIYDLAVEEAYRRRGIATAMLEFAQEIARERNAYLVWIQSEADDEAASAVYSQFAKPLLANSFEFSPDAKRGPK